MDFKNERESKNFVDHRNAINARPAPVTPDIDMFWRLMRQGASEDNYISHITDPNVNPTGPQPVNQQINPHDLLGALLMQLLRGQHG